MNETKHFKQLLLPKGVELNKLLKQLLQMLQKHPSPWGSSSVSEACRRAACAQSRLTTH